MSTKVKRRRISKAADSGQVHELTDMTVEEVSLVDRAANKRKFLVTKQDEPTGTEPANDAVGASGQAVDADVIEPAAARAELDKLADQAEQDVKDKDAKDAVEAAAAKAAEVAASADPVVPAVEPAPVVEAPVAVPVEAPITDPVAAIKAITSVSPPAVKKDDAAAEEAQEQIEAFEMSGQMKAALQGSLQAVADRLAVLRSLVDGAMEVSEPSYGVPYGVYAHIEYMCSMLYGVEALGGPEWEVAAAAMTTKADGKPVRKVGRPMRKERFERLKSAARSLSDLIAEMEGDPEATEKAAAPVVVTVAAPATPVRDPEVAQLRELVKSLQTMVQTQQRQAGAQQSNANSVDPAPARRDTFVWKRDMAAPERLDRQF